MIGAVLIAPNGFKGTLSSISAGRAIQQGIRRACPGVPTIRFPLSDGGRGFLDALQAMYPNLRRHQVKVHPPVGRPIAGFFLEGPDGVAYVEMATASGIHLVPDAVRRPAELSSYGTGELLRAVMARPSVHTIVIGLGDTATLDGGAGMLKAFGVRLLDGRGEPVADGNRGLGQVVRLDVSTVHPALIAFQARGGKVRCACDVHNTLLGPEGAAYTFGLQKGAAPDELPQLEANLQHWTDVVEHTFGRRARDLPGAGAAGGAGFVLAAGLGAELTPGAPWLTECLSFQTALAQAAAIVTGEGQLDHQSLAGKTTGYLAKLGCARNIPVIAFAGRVALTETDWRSAGFTAVYELPPHRPRHARQALADYVAGTLVRCDFCTM